MKTQQAGNIRRSHAAKAHWAARERELRWLYEELGWSQAKVGAYFGVTQQAIQNVMARLGVPPRSRANLGAANGRFRDGSQSRLYRVLIVKDRCKRCGVTAGLGIHHKNDDHYDNRIENLEVLCNPCHMSITKRKWWAAKKAGLPTPKSNAPTGWRRSA